jgi:hypothetical protein
LRISGIHKLSLGPGLMHIIKLLDGYIGSVGLAALIVSSGLLLIIATREAFEVDPRLREDEDPAGGIQRSVEWRYMSDFATDARLQLLNLVLVYRVAVTTMLVLAVSFFVIEGVVRLIGHAGASELVAWWDANPYVEIVFRRGIGLLVLIFGPLFLYQLGRVVYRVVKAREHHTLNKKPWW